MALLNRLERSLGRFAVPHLSLCIVLGQVFFWGVWYLGFFDLERILLLPAAVRAGEVWRVVSFLLAPPSTQPVFIAFTWYIFWMFGSALEEFWGAFRYNLFLFVGWALTAGLAFIYPFAQTTNLFWTGLVSLAFAFLNPNFEMLLFFILPVKVKWLALLQWLYYGYVFAVYGAPVKLAVLAAVATFLIFFSGEIVARLRTGRRRVAYQASQAASREDELQPRHRCRICGKTELTDPQMDFRYCSKCAGDECYCSEHLANHEHTTVPATRT